MVVGERASEALKEMDDQIVPWFQAAAASLLEDMAPEKALALALAKITGNIQLKVSQPWCVFTPQSLLSMLLHP